MEDKRYIYVVVRKDLSPEQQAVQACHASSLLHGGAENRNAALVLLGVKNEEELLGLWRKTYIEVPAHLFFEPDVNGSTAFATEPLTEDRRELFQDLHTLRFPRGLLYYIKVFLRSIRREITD